MLPVAQAAALLATVVGRDLEQACGVFRIARRAAKDRVISTVDPDAWYGRKTTARGFDGYQGHVGIDPDSEIVTATAVTEGNAGDATVAPTESRITQDRSRGGGPDTATEEETGNSVESHDRRRILCQDWRRISEERRPFGRR